MITGIAGSSTNPLHAGGSGVARPSAPPAAPAAAAAAEPAVPVGSQQAALAAQVASQPLVRAEQVERAKQLLASPNYPPRAILESVAKLLAANNQAE